MKITNCLAAGTKIKMADGMEKPIRDIRAGDKVCGGAGNASTVMNVVQGQESEIIELSTKGRHRIKLSPCHALMSDKGFIPARSSTVGTQLKTETGFTKIDKRVDKKENTRVYNLELSGDDRTFIANGLIVGDFLAERSAADNERPEIEDDFLKEFERLANEYTSQRDS